MSRSVWTAQGWDVRAGSLRWSGQRLPEVGSHQSLIGVAFAGLCGSDVAKLTRSPIPGPGYDWRPGHEIVGWDLGEAGPHLTVIDPLMPCNRCERCESGSIHLCSAIRRIGWDVPGGFAEVVVAPSSNVLPLPDGFSPANGVLVDPLAVAVHGVRCSLGRGRGRRLAIIGSGALAICTAGYAVAYGWDVTLLARRERKLASLDGLLDAAVLPLREVPRMTFDAVVDAASGRDDRPLATALDLVRDGGNIVVQTSYDPGVRLGRDLRDIFRRSVSVTGSFSFCRRDRSGDFAEALRILAQHPAWADPLVSAQFPLHELPAALASVTSRDHTGPIKAILTAGR